MPASLFSAEHDALREAVRRFAADRLLPHVADWDRAGDIPDTAVEAVAAQGFLDVCLPDGGPHGDLLAALTVFEELGRCGAGLAVGLLARAEARRLAGSDWQSASVLLAPAAGAGLRTHRDAGRYVASGHVGPVPALVGAAQAVLVADSHAGPVLAVADLGGKWQRHQVKGAIGWGAAGLAELTGTNVAVEPVAVGTDAVTGIEQALHRWWLLGAAITTAAAWAAWDDALAYAQQREAFGRPIGKFQAVRHGMADAATRLTAAQQLVRDTARAAVERSSIPATVATARQFAGRAAAATTSWCLQVHGGYGYTMEFAVQRAWRDALMFDGIDDEPLRMRVAQNLGL